MPIAASARLRGTAAAARSSRLPRTASRPSAAKLSASGTKTRPGRSGLAMMSVVSPVRKVAAISQSRCPSVKLLIHSAWPSDIW